jgi:hypothetical protein
MASEAARFLADNINLHTLDPFVRLLSTIEPLEFCTKSLMSRSLLASVRIYSSSKFAIAENLSMSTYAIVAEISILV